MTMRNFPANDRQDDAEPLRFPVGHIRLRRTTSDNDATFNDEPENPSLDSADHVMDSLEGVSRKINDLARALNCLGFFDDDDDDDRPRAA